MVDSDKFGDIPFEKKSSKKWIPNTNNNNTSQQALDISFEVLNNTLLKFEKTKDWSLIKDEICKKIQPEVLLQSFSMYAHINDHKNWTQSIIRINKLLICLSSYESNSDEDTMLQDYSHTLIDTLITKEMKVVYRALNNMRGAITNPMLRLLQTIVKFGKGKYIDIFISYFDFSLPSLNKILTPHKNELNSNQEKIMDDKQYSNSLRYNFINFFADLLSYAPSILRKDLLTENNKIMVNLSKYISKVDSDECTMLLINTFIEKVINESTFKKATKCKIFHEFLLLNILKKYQLTETSLECKKKIMEFFLLLFTNSELGMVFENSKPWIDVSSADNSNVTINGKKYKLNNKYIFNTVAKFKPWEDEMQLNTLVRILHKIPELVAPYLNQLNYINGTNEPKMTSFWIGQTLTLTRIINLPVPEIVLKVDSETLHEDEDEHNNGNTEFNYSLTTLADIISPPSITLSNLKQYINHDSKFIKHIGCQCIVFILKKLNLIKEFLMNQSSNNTNFVNDLINKIQNKLPDLHEYLKIIDSLYIESGDNTNLMLVSEITLILSLYTNIFTNLNNQVKLNNKNIFNALIAKGSTSDANKQHLSGLELFILDNYMGLQELNDSYKWWNKNNSELSLFTSLLRMAVSSNSDYNSKIVKMLEKLVFTQKVFNKKKILASPINALLESLIQYKDEDMSNIWQLIDECVQRTVTSPYKYIDISVKFELCSPLICCFIEQLSFFSKAASDTIEKKWIISFIKKLYTIGDFGLKTLLFESPVLDSTLAQKIWSEDSKSLSKNVYNLNELCELISSVTLFSKEQLPQAIQIIDLFLQKCSLSEKEKLKNSPIFDKILLTENNSGIITHILDVLRKNGILLNLDGKPEIFKHWLILLGSNDYDLSLNIISHLDKCFFNTMIESLEFDVKNLNNKECLLLVFFKILKFNLIGSKLTNSIVFKILCECGNFLSDDDMNLVLDQIDFSEFIVNSFTLISSRLFLEKIVLNHPVESLKYFKNCYSKKTELNTPMLILFASLLDKIDDDEIVKTITQETFTLLQSNNDEVLPFILPFAANKIDFENLENKEKLISSVCYLVNESTVKFTGPIIKFVTKLITFNTIEFELIKVWYYKTFLFINKKSAIISENEVEESEFLATFNSLSEIMKILDPWVYIPKIILNTSLEIVLLQKWAFKKEIIQFFICLCDKSSNEMLETNKAIQFILNNEKNPFKSKTNKTSTEITSLTSILLSTLYYKNIKLNSDVNIALQFIEHYEGTTTLKDRIFYNIMQSIESHTSVSWTQRIGSWDIIESGQELEQNEVNDDEKLIVKEKELLSINISKQMVIKTVNNFKFIDNKILPQECVPFNKWEKILVDDALYAGANDVIYDTRFIMLLILQNNELVNPIDLNEEDAIQVSRFNYKSLMKSGLFSLILISLSNKGDENSLIAYQILKHMVNTLPKTEEENKILKVDLMVQIYLKKIMFTFHEQNSLTSGDFAPPIYWYMLSQISFIILDPKHFLYEQVYKWVLSKPKLVKYELPIMNIFINFQIKNQDFENLNKCLNWLLRNMTNGLKTIDDINYLKLIKMFEFLLNFSNNCYCNRLTLSNINKFVYNIQKIVNDYSVITRYGVLSLLEAKKYANDFKMSHKNFVTNTEEYKQYLMILQESLNIQELALRFGVQLTSNKRLLKWTEDDGLKMIKRVCK
ncbi:hypothetical protein QEN19_002318 [Hanseniaspora menglaensis]